MLSRSAQGVYWMARYLARAGYLSRLLELQVQFLVDRSVEEIHFGWKRIYRCMKRFPPPGEQFLPETDEFALADAFTLADDLTFERSNPDSVWGAIASGRENARQMRHCISGEMWTCLNSAYLRMRDLEVVDIWRTPEVFYARTRSEIHNFVGVADATMYRGAAWRFMRLGRAIERAQLAVSLLQAQIDLSRRTDRRTLGWASMLRTHHALEAYGRVYGIDMQPDRVLDLLVADPSLPGSVLATVQAAATELEGLGAGPGVEADAAARRLAGRAEALILYDWPETSAPEELLEQVNQSARDLHDAVLGAFVDYAIQDSPLR
ncbi:MAG: alpha-E domain-containing protein [Acidobacteriota bacterium]|nr:alpha-E domain-containing protein [Acidobacteriota bacterium]